MIPGEVVEIRGRLYRVVGLREDGEPVLRLVSPPPHVGIGYLDPL